MIQSDQFEELNKLISEVAEIYSKRVREISLETLIWDQNQLQELRQIRKQLNLLFQIRDNCVKVLEDLEILKSYSSASHLN
jgi:hypothetical protein